MRRVSKYLVAFALAFVATPSIARGDPVRQEGQLVYTDAIAVLPVEFLSTDPFAAILAVDAYEAIVDAIGSIEGAYVLEPELILPFADLPARELGRQLSVSTVLESSIVAEPPIYRLRFRHVDAQTGSTVRSGEAVIGRIDPANADAVPAIREHLVESLFRKLPSDWERVVADAQATLLDGTRSFEERLAALSKLSPPRTVSRQHFSGYADNGHISGSVAVAAAQLAIDADDPVIRMRAWHSLAGVGDPNLVEPLLYALSSDGDARVRVEAARTLVGFLDQPGVRDALSLARSGDAVERVREAAKFSLLSSKEQQEDLRAVVLNTRLADDERTNALRRLRWEYDNPDAIDQSVVVAMADVARSSNRAELRSTIWFSLIGTSDVYLVEPLLSALAGDPAETVREVVVHGLAEFIDYPGVREALATAALADPSPIVREGARESLRPSG